MAASFDAALSNPAVVLDNGGGMLRAGFAGQEKPGVEIQCLVGRPKHERLMMDSDLSGDV